MDDVNTQVSSLRLSIGSASEYLGVSIDTLRRWENKGRITAYRSPGGHRYFEKDDLDNLFGKKYVRDEPTIRKPTNGSATTGEAPSLKIPSVSKIRIPINEPIRIIAVTRPQVQTYTEENKQSTKSIPMEIPTPPSQPNLQKPGVAKGASIMQEVSSKYNKEKLSTRFKVITATAIAILIILNLILFLLWRNSQAIISPIPTLP